MPDSSEVEVSKEHPVVTISEDSYESAGFTASGRQRFNDTCQEYVKKLFEKATIFAEASRGEGLAVEVTYQHVRSAAHVMSSYGRPVKPWWVVPCQLLEYFAAAGIGFGTARLDKQWGVATAFASLAIGALLLVLRLSKGKVE
jgi:hypothetical protein